MSLAQAGMGLEALAKACQALRDSALFDESGPILPPLAEQYYLLAVGALEQAQRFAMLAEYHVRRGD